MKKRRIGVLVCLLLGMAGMAHAALPVPPGVTFEATDDPGSWFECSNNASAHNAHVGCAGLAGVPASGKSLAVIKLGETIRFTSAGRANTIHTAVSLIYPTHSTAPTAPPAVMPFDEDLLPNKKDVFFDVTPTDVGLHVFYCDIHPYMFATVIVDNDDSAAVLPLGEKVDIPSVLGLTKVPTASDLVLRLVHTFFIVTNPDNWQNYARTASTWQPSYPSVHVLAYDKFGTAVNEAPLFIPGSTVVGVDLNLLLQTYFGETAPKTLAAAIPPTHPGVGEVWVDTQFERTGKAKPGTVTAVNAQTWELKRKVALDLNNPHNLWTDRNQEVIYQTEWFDHTVTVFTRNTGAFVRKLEAGDAPAHVMTRTNNDQVHVSQNGGANVREFDSLANENRFIQDLGLGTEGDAHPHAHWMSHDGSMMVTPNADQENSTLYILPTAGDPTGHVDGRPLHTGSFPIATGMMPDSSKYYVANFLDSSISVIGINKNRHPRQSPIDTINLLVGYAVPGQYDVLFPTVAPVGGLPIQTPVSPDGKYAIVANTLAATILVIETKHNTVVKSLKCDAGCHGVQFGAKKGGGYYAYVSSKFSNRMIVVDPDPLGNGSNGSEAIIAGSVLLTTANASEHFHADFKTHGIDPKYAGMGGQGVLPIPLVYNGWVQNLPHEWKDQLTRKQRNPIGEDEHGSH